MLLFKTRADLTEQPNPEALDKEPPADDPYAHVWWQMELAERRMMEALNELDQATRKGLSESALVAAEESFHHEAQILAVVLEQFGA